MAETDGAIHVSLTCYIDPSWEVLHQTIHALTGAPCDLVERVAQMTDQQTVIQGTRTITHDPLGADGERERGTIDAEGFDGQEWLGDNVGQVIVE